MAIREKARKKVVRTKTPGRDMLMWLLDKTDREIRAAQNDRKRLRVLKQRGPEYDPELYKQEGHPTVSSASQCQTRKHLEEHGYIKPWRATATGHVKHLLLTATGREFAIFLREHGGRSPNEVDKAVRRSSRDYNADLRKIDCALKDRVGNLNDMRRLWKAREWLELRAKAREQSCREYIKSLPVEQIGVEVIRIAKEGWEEPLVPPPPVAEFTDGGTVSFQGLERHESDAPEKALN